MKYGKIYTHVTRNTGQFSRTIWPFRKTELDYMLQLLSNEKPEKILDYGCNDGHFTGAIAQHLPTKEVMGCDINQQALKVARKKNKTLDFEHIGVQFYEKNKHFFNSIVMSHVLEHIHNRNEVVKEIYQLLDDNGCFIVAVPQERIRGDGNVIQILSNALTLTFENPHVVKFDYRSLDNLLTNNGFVIEQHIYTNYLKPKLSDHRKFHAWSLVVLARKVPIE